MRDMKYMIFDLMMMGFRVLKMLGY